MEEILQQLVRFWLVFVTSFSLLAGPAAPLMLGASTDACEVGCPCDDESASGHDDDHAHGEHEAVRDRDPGVGDTSLEGSRSERDGDAARGECSMDCSDCDCDVNLWVVFLTRPDVVVEGYPIEYLSQPPPMSRSEAPSFEIFIPPKHQLG